MIKSYNNNILETEKIINLKTKTTQHNFVVIKLNGCPSRLNVRTTVILNLR